MKRMLLKTDDDFDPDAIAGSGQCFRWERSGENSWRVLHQDSCLYITMLKPGTFELDCTQEEFSRLWRDYFDLDTNYREIRERIEPDRDPFLHKAARQGRGIRILRQDPWETAICFIISQNRNIPAIERSVAQLCRSAGELRSDRRGEVYYTFPTPEAILSLSREELVICRLGYRDKYILEAAKAACDGRFDPEKMRSLNDETLLSELEKLCGVGPKVASCIALFGFHRTNAFPVDTWIKKALDNEYPDGYPSERYRPYNGIYQQYIFACYRSAAARKSS